MDLPRPFIEAKEGFWQALVLVRRLIWVLDDAVSKPPRRFASLTFDPSRCSVMLSAPLSIAFMLLATVAVSLWLCDRYAWAKRVSALLLILGSSALCSNLGLIPRQSPVYGAVSGFCVPFAVCLVLFEVRLADLRGLGREMATSFIVASLASLVGVVCASLLLSGWMEQSIGPDHWKLAGPYAGTYVGGSLNFFALWQGLEIENPALFAAANAVDNLTIIPLMLVWTTAPRWLGSFFPKAEAPPLARDNGQARDTPSPTKQSRWNPTDIALLSAGAVGIIALGEWLTQQFIKPYFPDVPSILLVTTLALLAAQLKAVKSLTGAWDLGYLAFYLFFAAVGATIDVVAAIELSPVLFAYVAIVFVVHMLILFGAGKLLGINLAALIIASTATKGGPALVPSVAQAQRRQDLILPGILLGLLGYALGNYVGLAAAFTARSLL